MAGSTVPVGSGGDTSMATENQTQSESMTSGMVWLGIAIVVVIAVAYFAM
jgi:hypothetical protein